MDKPAAITAELVDVRNVGFNKSIKLTLHVPAERAADVMAAFGWPTAVDPVPVALARLNLKGGEAHKAVQSVGHKPPPASVDTEQAPPARAPRPFTSLPLPQQAALLCQAPVFWAFVNDDLELDCKNEDDATKMLRTWCAVDSRSEIKPLTGHGQYFIELRERFLAWKQVAA